MSEKKKILIVDDSEMNRALLDDMLSDGYEVIEAENGMEAMAYLHDHGLEVCLMLLDIVMPVMDGFETLAMMNKNGWIKNIPVIMISAETAFSYIDRAYGLGAVDYISRPFDERTVRHRVDSNVILAEKQRDLSSRLSAQIYEKEKDNRLMIEILSHIVEFRNGESGLHVLHVHSITELLLKALRKKTDKYDISPKEISLICNASALHDVGKITVPSKVLNKPGRFTPEEFEIMKKHTVEGEKMLDDIPLRENEPLIRVAKQICRWHHERYDGRGYPDGLKGEEIPIAAQVVSLADVYDALTSERVYKPPFTPEKAIEMIVNGECGAFNPLLLECLLDVKEELKTELTVLSLGNAADREIHNVVAQTLKTDGSDVSNRTVRLLEHERMKNKVIADLTHDIIFEYTVEPEMIELSDWGAEYLGMPVTITEPREKDFGKTVFKPEDFNAFLEAIQKTTPENPHVVKKYMLDIRGKKTWCKVVARSMWSDTEPPEYDGAIGKIVDVNDETQEMKQLEQKASLDFRTGLLNHEAAKEKISAMLEGNPGRNHALVMFDLDNFKKANDERGHLFGDEVLQFVADTVQKTVRSSDIAARMGGDEFVIFMQYRETIDPLIKRLFKNLCVDFKGFPVQLSMGIACTNENISYDELFSRADKAMYVVKNEGKNRYRYYDAETEILSADKKDD
ncbi:MAG: diguanylate cyclase [Clostridiales bacterium]|nr:diguanylate cyclase [Clostridiales bacterium]